MKRLLTHSGFRYLLATGLSFVLNLGITAVGKDLIGLPAELAVAIAFIVVFVLNFLIMRHFIYRAADQSGMKQIRRYVLSAIAFRTSEWLACVVLFRLGLPEYPSLIAVLVTAALLKYVFYGLVVFKRPR